jgi:hypothetical protein
MQAADDVKLRRAFRYAFRRALVNLIQRKRVSAGRIRRTPESAKAAMRDANIRGINMPVDVVVADIAVFLLADIIPEASEANRAIDTARRRLPTLSRPANTNGTGLQPRVRYFEFSSLAFEFSGPPDNCCGAQEQKE